MQSIEFWIIWQLRVPCHYFTSFSIAMYAILSLFFYIQFAVTILTNIGFVRLSPFQLDYMYVAHSKFNGSNTPKE